MLGRLRMPTDECIQAYRDFARRVFTPKTTRKPTSDTAFGPAFSAKRHEDAIKSIIRQFCPEEQCKNCRKEGQSTAETCPHQNVPFRDGTCTKTIVLAITRDNIDAPPTLFRTYDSSTAFEACTIWEVAQATSAAVSFFESIRLGRDNIEFVDAAFGYNNPCEVLVQEARRQFPDRRQMRILSIGSGLGDVVTIKDSQESIIRALEAMAASSKKVAHNLNCQFDDHSEYFRFNVDQGLKDITLWDWKNASTISANTHNYLAEKERAIGRFVDSLTDNVSSGGDGCLPATGRRHFSIPFERNRDFVGRESILEQLLTCVAPSVNRDYCQRTAIVGLGGVGKTQIALEVAFRVNEKHPDCSVFWIPAIDAVGFRNAFRKIGQLLEIRGINDDKAEVEELVKTTLSNESAGSWLLIVDNADSQDLLGGRNGLARHLPASRQGSLLFTSRNRALVVDLGVPVPNILNVEAMNANEGLKFLETHLAESQMSNWNDTAKLLEVLGYLPLALKQASAYMAR
ncbi:hypothetical protein VTN49DRAFT_3453 [Thermomyces lanuginosus]|uniref:uncharacterized protein n=1 Tax=Thermomyces lanuginosus TaxID=5541 RepID=UPI003741F581